LSTRALVSQPLRRRRRPFFLLLSTTPFYCFLLPPPTTRMFQQPQVQPPPQTPAASRSVAQSALRRAGLMDGDAKMRDMSRKSGDKKAGGKTRSHRPHVVGSIKDSGPAARNSVNLHFFFLSGLPATHTPRTPFFARPQTPYFYPSMATTIPLTYFIAPALCLRFRSSRWPHVLQRWPPEEATRWPFVAQQRLEPPLTWRLHARGETS
jgi:hypothetical protein